MDKLIFTHKFNSIESLINILKDNKIVCGSKLDKKYRILSGGEPSNYVYTTILNKKLLENKIDNDIPTVLISPKILKSKKMIFNKMWQSIETKDSIITNPKENNKNKLKKIFKIIDETLEKKVGWPYNNEALFRNEIKMKYIFGIVIPKKYLSKIKKYLPEDIKIYHSYENIFDEPLSKDI